MGAEVFYNKAKGTNARESFKEQHEQACYDHGHSGYSGTLAEKSGFTMSEKPREVDADEWVEKVDTFDSLDREQEHYGKLKRDSEVYDDKWGSALCVPTEDGFIFCGWASS